MEEIRCVRCGQPIELYEIELTDVSLRELWYSRIPPESRPGKYLGIRSGTLTTMCGLGDSEEIPPDQIHVPARPASTTTASPAGGETSATSSTAGPAVKPSPSEPQPDEAPSSGERPSRYPGEPGSA